MRGWFCSKFWFILRAVWRSQLRIQKIFIESLTGHKTCKPHVWISNSAITLCTHEVDTKPVLSNYSKLMYLCVWLRLFIGVIPLNARLFHWRAFNDIVDFDYLCCLPFYSHNICNQGGKLWVRDKTVYVCPHSGKKGLPPSSVPTVPNSIVIRIWCFSHPDAPDVIRKRWA